MADQYEASAACCDCVQPGHMIVVKDDLPVWSGLIAESPVEYFSGHLVLLHSIDYSKLLEFLNAKN